MKRASFLALLTLFITLQGQNELHPNILLIVSEFGGPLTRCNDGFTTCQLGPTKTQKMHTENYHAERVAFYLETLAGLDIEVALHFKLVEINDPTHGRV